MKKAWKPPGGMQQMIAVITEMGGNVSACARRFKTDRHVMERYIAKHAETRQAVKDQREAMLDTAESVLGNRVLAGEGWAVCFLLKTQGKHRGYVERQEITGVEGGAAIKLHWVGDEDGHNPSPVAPGAAEDCAE